MLKSVQTVSKGLHYVAQITLSLMMFMITFDVLARWLFKKPITGSVDFTSLSLLVVIFLNVSYTHLKKRHITIDFFVDLFSKKTQLIIESVVNFIIALFMAVLSLSLLSYAGRLFSSNTVTPDLRFPMYMFAILAGIGTVTFVLVAIVHIINDLKKVRGLKE